MVDPSAPTGGHPDPPSGGSGRAGHAALVERRRRRAQRLILAGGAVFGVGLLAVGAGLVVWGLNTAPPGALFLLALLCPTGLAICFAGLVVHGRSTRS